MTAIERVQKALLVSNNEVDMSAELLTELTGQPHSVRRCVPRAEAETLLAEAVARESA
jgi:hypothetical protein